MTSPKQTRILITGFEPFGGDDRNPTQVIVERLGGIVLPTEYVGATTRLNESIDVLQPTAMLLCGLNQRATGLRLERQAINEDNTTLPDNAGELRLGTPIDADGLMTLPATAPLAVLGAALDATGLPWEWSDSAGRFICNHAYYIALRRRMYCVFLHVPWPSDWGPDRPGQLTLSQIEIGVRACAAAIAGAVDVAIKEPRTK